MTEAFNVLFEKGRALIPTDADQALEIFEEALALAASADDRLGTGKCHVQLSRVYSIKGAYIVAIRHANQGLEMAEFFGDQETLYHAYYSLGNIYAQLGNLEKGLDYYQKGLEICQVINADAVNNYLNNMAVIYSKMGMLDRSLQTLLQAYELSLKKPSALTGFLASNIAEVYHKLDQNNLALEYNEKAASHLAEHPYTPHYAIQLHKVFGSIYWAIGELEMAETHFRESLELSKKHNMPYRQATTLMEVGKSLMVQEKYAEAAEVLKSAFDIAADIDAKVEQRDLAKHIAKCYEHLKSYKSAYNYLNLFNQLDGDIRTRKLEEALLLQHAEFELDQAKQENVLLTRSISDVKFISEIGRIITSSLNMDHVLSSIYVNIGAIKPMDTLGIFLYREELDDLDVKLFMEYGEEIADQITPTSPDYLRAIKCVKQNAMAIYHKNAKGEPASLLYIPLVFMSRVIGTITLQKREKDVFGQREIELATVLASYIAIALHNSQQSENLEIKSKALETLSRTDELTGIFNRRYAQELIEIEHARAHRVRSPYCIALLDLDYFKGLNDSYGHQTGDLALIQFCQKVSSEIRPYDIFARWGGEEFIICFPNTDLKAAQAVCERIKQSVSELVYGPEDSSTTLTVTIGVVEVDYNTTVEHVIHRADEALYAGKNLGRNRVNVSFDA